MIEYIQTAVALAMVLTGAVLLWRNLVTKTRRELSDV